MVALGLTFSYGSDHLFKDYSAHFDRGAITAITGPSGRGKSTLLYLLGLLLNPESGQILLDDQVISGGNDAQRSLLRARTIGMVFQDSMLDPHRSVLDSVTEPAIYAGVARSVARSSALSMLAEVGLSERAPHKPGEISGGQAQRAALVRALLLSPPILLADEPTGNLDHENATIVLDLMRKAANTGCSVVVATHDPFVIRKCDREVAL